MAAMSTDRIRNTEIASGNNREILAKLRGACSARMWRMDAKSHAKLLRGPSSEWENTAQSSNAPLVGNVRRFVDVPANDDRLAGCGIFQHQPDHANNSRAAERIQIGHGGESIAKD